MRLSAAELNRATLERQMLLRRQRINVGDAVRKLVGLQAQEAATPYLALWNRIADFDPAELDQAFADRTIVKATLLRTTLHAVHTADYPDIHQAMLPTLRASRLTDRRFLSSGLSVAEADALLAPLARFTRNQPRTRAEVETMIATQLGESRPYVWWALRTFAPLHYAPTGGPWSFSGPYAVLAAPSKPAEADANEPMSRLIVSYLQAFGPATAQDLGRIGRDLGTIRATLHELGDELDRFEDPNGAILYDAAGSPIPDEDVTAPPRLLPMWDQTLLAYADRSRIIPPEYRKLVCRMNGNILPTLLVDGRVAGVWRPVPDGIEATAFHPLDQDTWAGLAAEADALTAVLANREPSVYRKYEHWWTKPMPKAQVRQLPE